MIRVQAARAFFLALAILADAPPASAQVFPETFADGLTGSYWARESPTPSGGVSVTERNGRLPGFEFSNAQTLRAVLGVIY